MAENYSVTVQLTKKKLKKRLNCDLVEYKPSMNVLSMGRFMRNHKMESIYYGRVSGDNVQIFYHNAKKKDGGMTGFFGKITEKDDVCELTGKFRKPLYAYISAVILILLNPTLFGISIFLMIPFFVLSSIVIVRNIPKFRKNAQESFARYTNWMEPIVESGDAIAVFDGQDIVLDKVREESEKIMRENIKAHKRTAWSSAVTATSGMTGYILLLLIGNSMIGTKVRDFAQLMKVTQYRGHMMMGIMCVNAGVNNMKTNLTGAVRVDEILEGEKQHG